MANSVEQIKKDEVQIVETPATGPTTASTETPSEDVKVEIEAGKEQPAAPATKLAAPLSREEAEKEILRQGELSFNADYLRFLSSRQNIVFPASLQPNCSRVLLQRRKPAIRQVSLDPQSQGGRMGPSFHALFVQAHASTAGSCF